MDDWFGRFSANMHQFADDAQRGVCPIFGIRESVGGPIGSGFLLRVGTETLLLTAAHVVYRRYEIPLYIPGADHPIVLEGDFYTTGPRNRVTSPQFGVDIAFVVLNPRTASECSGCTILTPDDFDVADTSSLQTLYGFTGFPGDENQVIEDHTLLRRAYYYGGQPAPDSEYRYLGIDRRSHFIMAFEREHAVDTDGQTVYAPDPHGMSGGPVWKLGTFQEVDLGICRPKVIGIAIEWWENRRTLVCVRVGVAVEAIRRILPDLAAHLPATPYLKVNVLFDETTA